MAVHRAVQMWMFLRLSASNAKAFLWREGWRRKCWKRCKCERHHKSQMKISHNFKCKSLAYNKKITPLPSPPSTPSLTPFPPPPTHTHQSYVKPPAGRPGCRPRPKGWGSGTAPFLPDRGHCESVWGSPLPLPPHTYFDRQPEGRTEA